LQKIVIAGDVAIDWLAWEKKPETELEAEKLQSNWTANIGLQMHARPGGAMLLAQMLQISVNPVQIHSYSLSDPEKIPPDEIIHSNTLFAEYPVSINDDSGKKVFRVKQFFGFAGPENGKMKPLFLQDDDADARLIILDDAANGFRDEIESWPKALWSSEKKPNIILKMSRPLVSGKLWSHLITNHSDRLIVVINAKDLRENESNISYKLSWERTAQDFLWQIQNNEKIRPLTECNTLIVRFGNDGVIVYSEKPEQEVARLFYDPLVLEDGFAEQYPGKMQGVFCAFIAGFVSKFLDSDNKIESLDECIQRGIFCSRNLVKMGLGQSGTKPDYNFGEVFMDSKESSPELASIDIPKKKGAQESFQYWTILENLTRTELENIARDIIIFGTHPSLTRVPIGSFGMFKTIDRQEIESYQSIKNILQEYISSNRSEPISIAVFGPPGSGKSFGVTQLAKSIGKARIEKIECNISQFRDPDELIMIFHRIRDSVLNGMIPLVFFDEFDSYLDGNLGWLKYFLAPMQDGKFKSGEAMHPIGKAIFVFAGGTSSSYNEFRYGKERKESDKKTAKSHEQRFRDAKGTDFVSRLRGYIDIMGCNPIGEKVDAKCIIRRGLLFRSLLDQKAKHLIDSKGQAHIDSALINAILKVPYYTHGVRSMQAIIDMSMVSNKRKFDQSSLPSQEQLELHVDAESFMRLVDQDVLFQSTIGTIAQEIHRQYLKLLNEMGEDNRANVPWEDLDDDLKESNKRQAEDIKAKLEEIDCWFRPKETNNLFEFSREEILLLAEKEHNRWILEKKEKGWRYGKIRDDLKKIHPDLVDWEHLPEESKRKDMNSIENIPKLLANVGFEIYRLE